MFDYHQPPEYQGPPPTKPPPKPSDLIPKIDPVCFFHGKKRSEHECLYCALCFRNLTPEECWVDDTGQKWDVCVECKENERRNDEST